MDIDTHGLNLTNILVCSPKNEKLAKKIITHIPTLSIGVDIYVLDQYMYLFGKEGEMMTIIVDPKKEEE